MLFHVLGPLEVHGHDGRGIEISAEKRRRLLAALLLKFDGWAAVDFLVAAVWPGRPPASATGNLKTYVHHLRQVVPPRSDGGPRIESRPGYYRLRVDRDECDATTFADLVGRGRTALQEGVPAAAVTHFQEALALWRGEPFETLDADTTGAEAALLRELRWSARDDLADALLAAGRPAVAISLLTPLTAEDPLREPTWQRLLTAYHRADRRADGLAAYRQARQHLVNELGVEPGAELQRLHRLLLADPEPVPADSAGESDTESAVASAAPSPQVEEVTAVPATTGGTTSPPAAPAAPATPATASPPHAAAPAGPNAVAGGPTTATEAPPTWDSGVESDVETDVEDALDRPRWRVPYHLAVSAGTALVLLIGALLFTLSDPPWDYGSRGGSTAAPEPTDTPVNQVRPKTPTPVPRESATSGPRKAESTTRGGNTKPKQPTREYSGTPKLSFLSPGKHKTVSGTITIRVKVSNPKLLSQVDFHYLTLMCEPGGYKEYIGNDKTPDANGVYEIRFDTDKADDGCLHFGAVGVGRDGDTLYPPDGEYVRVTVNN